MSLNFWLICYATKLTGTENGVLCNNKTNELNKGMWGWLWDHTVGRGWEDLKKSLNKSIKGLRNY